MAGVTIAIQNKGSVLPDGYLKELLKTHNKTLGVALLHTDGKQIGVMRKQPAPDFGTIKNMLTKFKDSRIVLSFGDAEEISPESMQPLTVLTNSEGQPTVIAMLDGDFSEFEKQGSSHSAESYAVAADLTPRIQRLYDLAEHKVELLPDELLDQTNSRRIGNLMLGDRGTILIMCLGEPVLNTISGDTTCAEFPWGWVSNTHGYVEQSADIADELAALAGESGAIPPVKEVGAAAVAPKSAPAEATSNRKGKRPGAGAGVQIASTAPISPKPATQPDDGDGDETPPVQPPISVVIPDDEVLRLKIPNNIRDSKRPRWMRKRTPGEVLLPNFMEATEIVCKKKDATATFLADWIKENRKRFMSQDTGAKAPPIKSFKELGAAAGTNGSGKPTTIEPTAVQPKVHKGNRPTMEGGYPPKAGDPPAPVKDTTVHNAKSTPSPIVTDATCVIPPSQKKEVLAVLDSKHFKDAADRHSKLTADPKQFSKFEQRVDEMAKQLGLPSIDATMNWPLDEVLAMARNNATAITVWAFEWKHKAMKLAKDLFAAEQLLTEVQEKHTDKQPVVSQPIKQAAVAGGKRGNRPSAF